MSDIEKRVFLMESLPEEIGIAFFALFCSGWSSRAHLSADGSGIRVAVRVDSPFGGVDDSIVVATYDGAWKFDDEASGLVSSDGEVTPREAAAVVDHVFRHIPAWLVPEVGTECSHEFVDLHDRPLDEGDPVIDAMGEQFEPVATTMFRMLMAGWDATLSLDSDYGCASISALVPGDLDDEFRRIVDEAFGTELRSIRFRWLLQDGKWSADPAQTGSVRDGVIEAIGFDELLDAVAFAGANCAMEPTPLSGRWHSAGATTPSSHVPVSVLEAEDPSPSVVADRLRRIGEWAVSHGFSGPLEPSPGDVARYIDRERESRAGYYVLQFTDGQCYVGESIDIPERLKQHRTRFQDIDGVWVRTDSTATRSILGKRHLRLHEKELIHAAQNAGLLARNINEMATMIGVSKYLDDLVPSDEQRQWLEAPDLLNSKDGSERPVFSEDRLARMEDRFRYFRTRVDAAQIERIIGHYLKRCVPFPARTEHHCWAISCLTAPGKRQGRISCLTIAMTETMVFYDDRERGAGGKIQVNEAELFPTEGAAMWFLRRHPTVRLSDAVYQESGPGQLWLHADTLDALERLLDDVAVTRAAATTALHIMRKGPCMQRKVHCPQLVAAALAAAG